jgi:hypothetical protein
MRGEDVKGHYPFLKTGIIIFGEIDAGFPEVYPEESEDQLQINVLLRETS